MRNVSEVINEIVNMILAKNIDYNPSEFENKKTKLDVVKENVERIEKRL